jgi:hypothetical protein
MARAFAFRIWIYFFSSFPRMMIQWMEGHNNNFVGLTSELIGLFTATAAPGAALGIFSS